MAKLLLHTCCGPCFLGTWEVLKAKEFDIINLFYNPNIKPEEEYSQRLDGFKQAIIGKSKDYLVVDYDPKEHTKAVLGYERNQTERCKKCYELRLRRTAEIAKENKIGLFSSTLLVSPYQNHEELLKIGNKIAFENKIEFLKTDFRPGFRVGQNNAKELGIYRQKYCGCLFSKEESLKGLK